MNQIRSTELKHSGFSFSPVTKAFLFWHVAVSQVVLVLAFLSGIYLNDTLNRVLFFLMMSVYLLLAAHSIIKALATVKEPVKKFLLGFWHVCFSLFLIRVMLLTLTTL